MANTKTAKNWVLKSKVTGRIYPDFTYKSREAARKAAKGRRFKGEYTPFKFVPTTRHTTKTVKPSTINWGSATRTIPAPSVIKKDPMNLSNFVSKMNFWSRI